MYEWWWCGGVEFKKASLAQMVQPSIIISGQRLDKKRNVCMFTLIASFIAPSNKCFKGLWTKIAEEIYSNYGLGD